MSDLNHFDGKGNAIMVDVSSKEITERIAVASCDVHVNPATMALVLEGGIKKGDVLSVARLAGILGAKKPRTYSAVPSFSSHISRVGSKMR